MKPTINIVIEEDGTVTVAPDGVKGKSCLLVTKEIEQALGKTVDSKPTREMHEREPGYVQHQNRS